MKNSKANDHLEDDALKQSNDSKPEKKNENNAATHGSSSPEKKIESGPEEDHPHGPADLLHDDPTAEDAYEVDDYDAEEKAHHSEDPEEEDGSEGVSIPEDQKVNYELLSKEDLVKLLEEKMNTLSFNQLRGTFNDIVDIFNRKVEAETEQKKKTFLEEGGNEEDFKPVEDPVNQKMYALEEKYKSLKSEFSKQLEQSKEQNLKEKEQILEEFRQLMEGQDSFENTFRTFKHLQRRWFEIGIVPQQNVRDLWNSYNFFVEKFNDYVKINRELRVLDLNKNLELKARLCEKAEALAAEEDVVNAFKTLQKYHAQWREIGPVPREEKDAIWERFKTATSIINKAHQEHQVEMRESLVKNLEEKEKLCTTAETLASGEYTSHKEWSNKTNELLNLQEEWKKIGYAPKKHNNQIYARFRKECDAFFAKKASFYAEAFEIQKENLKKKESLVLEAEELRESKEWKETTSKLIELQKRWKAIGPVPRKESDQLWKRFRGACDQFFNQKSEFFGGKDASYEENLNEKETVIDEMKKYDPNAPSSELISDLETFQERYNEIGFVPIEKKDEIRDRFRKEFNSIIDRTGMSEKDKSILRFRIRMMGILASPKAQMKFSYERDKIYNKLQQLKSDISVLENNIGFFKETKSSEDTISGFQDKLTDAHTRIEILESKLRVMDELESEL
jgi:hypothetical protein